MGGQFKLQHKTQTKQSQIVFVLYLKSQFLNMILLQSKKIIIEIENRFEHMALMTARRSICLRLPL